MKPKVDIFRPLAAATSSAKARLPDSSSIFRRSHHDNRPQNSHGEDDDEDFVVSTPPEPWAPLPVGALSASTSDGHGAQQKGLEVSAPLPSVSSGEASTPASPVSPSRTTGLRSLRAGGRSPKKGKASPPSYYKIQLVDNGDDSDASGSGGMVQLTAGDDASVQIAPDHNEGLQLAASTNSSRARRQRRIVRASPVVEHAASGQESIEHEADEGVGHHIHRGSHHAHEADKRWTVSDGGQIIAVPPSPSRVSMTHDYEVRRTEEKTESVSALASPSEYLCAPPVPPLMEMETELLADPEKPTDEGDAALSVPPRLVKANSSGSSSSEGSFVSEGHIDTMAMVDEEEGEEVSLESPPRMNRSLLSISLFQESLSTSSKGSRAGTPPAKRVRREGSLDSKQSKSSRNSHGTGRSSSPHVGGCGTCRSSGAFEWLMDVFSLNGPCCRQPCAAN
ncbi:hypothetical protein ACHAXT_001657 [Thalassiosira profunda]